MKKFISIMLCVCICLSSTVFCFADFTSTDSTTLSNIYRYMPTSSQITTLSNTLSTISTRTLNIYNSLFDDSHSVAYWVNAISTWMQPIYATLGDILQATINPAINPLIGMLSSSEDVNGVTQRTPYLLSLKEVFVNNDPGVQSGFNNQYWRTHLHQNLFTTNYRDSGMYNNPVWDVSNGLRDNYIYASYGTPLGNLAVITNRINLNLVNGLVGLLTGAIDNQSYTSWSDLSSGLFTPTSMSNGIYSWLSNIQAPVARLSYVLASDERIEAQEAAAANEEAVVDNFIDSSGSGAASTSDIGSVSDLSSGFKNNISTDASVSGIWNIFNSDNFGWFSQETADQLDTTSSSTRTLRSSGSYPTPLLDQQTENILMYIGGDDND